jgi:hypothetical protein
MLRQRKAGPGAVEATLNPEKERAMRTKHLWTIYAMAFLFVGWGITADIVAAEREVKPQQESRIVTEASQQHLIFEDLGSAEGLDVYNVSSSASNAKCVTADVADEGPFFDTTFYVIIVGRSGSGLAGRAVHKHSPVGGLSSEACRCRSNTGSLGAYVVIGEGNHAGPEQYSTLIDVRASSCTGGSVSHSVSKTQDQ